MKYHHLLYPSGLAVLLPIIYKLLPPSVRSKVCTSVKCLPTLAACTGEPECRAMLRCFGECEDPNSERRASSAERYRHVQFPRDPALCTYDCFGHATTESAERVIECVGGSGCMEPAEYSDECANIGVGPDGATVLPFSAVPPTVWEGRWTKALTNSWDTWPCQSTEFFPPGSTSPEPKAWMKSWPDDPTVWRMDLNWTQTTNDGGGSEREFAMSNEMHPSMRWRYEGGTEADPTLRTRAVMWGVEEHENWYLLHHDEESQAILIHVCAYTPAIESYDAMTIVFKKGRRRLTDDEATKLQGVASRLLGEKFGTLLRPTQCPHEETVLNA